jgi:hypothetical protein
MLSSGDTTISVCASKSRSRTRNSARASEILLQETRHRDASVAVPRADQQPARGDDGRRAVEERGH